MEISFQGQVALVTGAASGLDLAMAKTFVESGASVVLADMSEQTVMAAAKDLADKGSKTLGVRCDVSKDEEVKALVEKTVETLGRGESEIGAIGKSPRPRAEAPSASSDVERLLTQVDVRPVPEGENTLTPVVLGATETRTCPDASAIALNECAAVG